MIIPNADRVLIKVLKAPEKSNGIIIAGQLKAGENLFLGEVIRVAEPYKNLKGEEVVSRFKPGQKVYYSEYSAAAITDIMDVITGKETIGENASKKEEKTFMVVAEDDIMAYDKTEVA